MKPFFFDLDVWRDDKIKLFFELPDDLARWVNNKMKPFFFDFDVWQVEKMVQKNFI